MDVMQIRRLLIGMIAGGGNVGADFVKGTFTVPSDASSFTLNFGKTFSKYLFFIEMTESSKEDMLVDTSLSGRRAYSFVGEYPKTVVNDKTNNIVFVYTYVPSTESVSSTTTVATTFVQTESSITNACYPISSNVQTTFVRDASYNYFVVEIQ